MLGRFQNFSTTSKRSVRLVLWANPPHLGVQSQKIQLGLKLNEKFLTGNGYDCFFAARQLSKWVPLGHGGSNGVLVRTLTWSPTRESTALDPLRCMFRTWISELTTACLNVSYTSTWKYLRHYLQSDGGFDAKVRETPLDGWSEHVGNKDAQGLWRFVRSSGYYLAQFE